MNKNQQLKINNNQKLLRARKFLISLVTIAVIVFVSVSISSMFWVGKSKTFQVPITNAASNTVPITGWAWSSNIGWISFSGSTYGVRENLSTGAITGYAWSSSSPDPRNPSSPSGIGWLDFGVSNPTHPAANVNLTSGKITGYARFSSGGTTWGSSSDGWISLSGSSYGITQNLTNGKWNGYAWEPVAVGWIKVRGTSYGVQAASARCTLPWGTTISSGSSVTAYKNPSVTFPATCLSQTRICTNGNLSGSYAYPNCSSVPASICSDISPSGTLYAYPNRVNSTNTNIRLSWTLTNVKRIVKGNGYVCKLNKEPVGGTVTKSWTLSLPSTCNTTNSYITDNTGVKTQTVYYISCSKSGTGYVDVPNTRIIVNTTPLFKTF